jgi:hypothetical protein
MSKRERDIQNDVNTAVTDSGWRMTPESLALLRQDILTESTNLKDEGASKKYFSLLNDNLHAKGWLNQHVHIEGAEKKSPALDIEFGDGQIVPVPFTDLVNANNARNRLDDASYAQNSFDVFTKGSLLDLAKSVHVAEESLSGQQFGEHYKNYLEDLNKKLHDANLLVHNLYIVRGKFSDGRFDLELCEGSTDPKLRLLRRLDPTKDELPKD